VRQNELSINSGECISVPDSLEEQTRKLDGETLWASTIHDRVWEGNVRLVVRRVEIFTIPAAGEHELETNAIEAISVQVIFVRHEVTVEGAFASDLVVETVETKGLLR